MESISMGIVETHPIETHALQLMYREPNFAHFWKSFFWKELIITEKW